MIEHRNARDVRTGGRRLRRVREDEDAAQARRERVAFLAAEVAAGRYRIDDRALAEALCDYITGLNEARVRR